MTTRRPSWPPTTLDDILRFLAHPKTEYPGGASMSPATIPWELSSRDYLGFARTDLRQRGTRGQVNALGNAKRALHCQIDSILYCVGYWDRAEERRWDFNSKITLLRDMQIIAPQVLSQLNRLRNEVEHKHSVPHDAQHLKTFIDTVELFIFGTDRFAQWHHRDFPFTRPYRSTERFIEILYDDDKKQLVVRTPGQADWLEVVRVDPTDKQYRRLLTATFVAAHRTGCFH